MQDDGKGKNFFRRDNTSFVEACLPPAGALGGRIQYAPTLPAGDVSYLYPQRLPRTPTFLLLDLPFLMSLVGAYRIRPPDDPTGADKCFLEAPFSSTRVGRKSIRPPNGPTGAGVGRWEGGNF